MLTWTLPGAMIPPVTTPSVTIARMDFDTLYERHVDFVWRNLRRMGVHESHLDDATQEVFLVVHRRLAEFEGRSSEKTWLYGIALRVASEFRRWNRRKNQHDPLPDTVVAAGDDPHDHAERREAARLLDRMLDAIPEERRNVFVLMELEGFSAPEVAAALSIPVNTVYSRLRLARADFERAVERHPRSAS
jgi:RNA polymerase sigma-70 factor (ECF subfamily)